MSRSSRITGILASLASLSTASQPDDTTGARKIASTPCATKERIALIWFSCFCCASAIFRLTLRLAASDLETVVSAARQPDSDPICEKPTVSCAAPAGRMDAALAIARPSKMGFSAIRRCPLVVNLFILGLVAPKTVIWHLSSLAGRSGANEPHLRGDY